MPRMARYEPVPVSRRDFIARVAALGAGAVGLPLLAACGGERSGPGSTAGAVVVDSSTCAGHDALPPEQEQMRASMGYIDASPTPQSHCSNCRFFEGPAAAAPCGACQLFQGPVSPGGWCRSWAATAAGAA